MGRCFGKVEAKLLKAADADAKHDNLRGGELPQETKLILPPPVPRPNFYALEGDARKEAVRAFRLAVMARGREITKLKAQWRRGHKKLAREMAIERRKLLQEAETGMIFRDKLLVALQKEKADAKIIRNLIAMATDEDKKRWPNALKAIQEIFDRIDGKPAQMVTTQGQQEIRVVVERIG